MTSNCNFPRNTYLRRVLFQLSLHLHAQPAHALHGLLARDGFVLRARRRRVGGVDYVYLDWTDGVRDASPAEIAVVVAVSSVDAHQGGGGPAERERDARRHESPAR